MSSVTEQITSMQSQTAYAQSTSSSSSTSSIDSDYTMFLTLMLEQLQNQDPTEPMDNSEWLAQLAQYSTLEQMAELNSNMEDVLTSLDDISSSIGSNAVITQTLSLVGKEVTIEYTSTTTDDDGTTSSTSETVTGVVTEAKFDGGIGYVKVGDSYYSIGNVTSIRESTTTTTDTEDTGEDTETSEAVEAAAAVYSATQQTRSTASIINSIL